ncbi:MAG: LTA synthase family protein, partial [Bacteroidota bacterium]
LAFVALSVFGMRTSRAKAWVARGERAASGAVPAPAVASLMGIVALSAGTWGGGEYARFFWLPPAEPWGEAPETAEPLFEASGARALATDSTQAYNVVIVIQESVRARSTGPWGGPSPTPALDSLAARGLVVDELLAMTPYTNKTVGALLAGVAPSPKTRLEATRPGGLPAVGLPDLLRPHGYRSAFFTPATLFYERKDRILENLGFDYMAGADEIDPEYDLQYDPRVLGVDDQAVVEPTLEWVASGDEPFLLSLLTLSGHYPYVIAPEAPTWGLSDAELEADYLDAVAYTDRTLGALVDGLDALGVLDSTIIIIVGDHGQAFGEYGLYAHGDGLYQEALHVPGVVVAPGLAPGRARGARQLTDIVPTVLDLLDLRLDNARLPGRSLLTAEDPSREIVSASHHEHMATSWRQGRWKAICRLTCREMEVYDISVDPHETQNVAEQWPLARRDSVGRAMAAWRARAAAAYGL